MHFTRYIYTIYFPNIAQLYFINRSWLVNENQAKPSYIFRSGSRLKRSSSSACSSCHPSDKRPLSLFGKYPLARNSGHFINTCCNNKNDLETIKEKSSNDENASYIIRIGCNNWVGRLGFMFLFNPISFSIVLYYAI